MSNKLIIALKFLRYFTEPGSDEVVYFYILLFMFICQGQTAAYCLSVGQRPMGLNDVVNPPGSCLGLIITDTRNPGDNLYWHPLGNWATHNKTRACPLNHLFSFVHHLHQNDTV